MVQTTMMAAVMEIMEDSTNMLNRMRKLNTQGRPRENLKETRRLATYLATPEVSSTPVMMNMKKMSRMVLFPNPLWNA